MTVLGIWVPALPLRPGEPDDTQSDPYELRSLAGDPGLEPVLERLRQELTDWRADQGDIGEDRPGY